MEMIISYLALQLTVGHVGKCQSFVGMDRRITLSVVTGQFSVVTDQSRFEK
jgi:hypothetical protein